MTEAITQTLNPSNMPAHGVPESFSVFASVVDGAADSLARGLTSTASGLADLSYQLGGAPPPPALEAVEAACSFAGLAIYPVMGLIRAWRARFTMQRLVRRKNLGLSIAPQITKLAQQSTGVAAASILTIGAIPGLGNLPGLGIVKSVVAIGFGASLTSWGVDSMRQAKFAQAMLADPAIRVAGDEQRVVTKKVENIVALLKRIKVKITASKEAERAAAVLTEDYQKEFRDLLSDEVGPTVAARILAVGYNFDLAPEGSKKNLNNILGWSHLLSLLNSGDESTLELCKQLISVMAEDAKQQLRVGSSLFWIGIFLVASQLFALFLRCFPAVFTTEQTIELLMLSSILLSGVQVYSIVADIQSYNLARREDVAPFINWLEEWQTERQRDSNDRLQRKGKTEHQVNIPYGNANNIPAII